MTHINMEMEREMVMKSKKADALQNLSLSSQRVTH